jgi:hypothetical protein
MLPCSPITSPHAAEGVVRPQKIASRCELVHTGVGMAVLPLIPDNPRGRDMIYSGFEIHSFEAGSGLWHARIQRADQEPVVIDGMPFPTLEVGFAWPDPDAAVADAKAHIDRLARRYATPRRTPTEHRTSP